MSPKSKKKCPKDCIQLFKALNLHDKCDTEEDFVDKPFILSGIVKEEHGGQIYGCAFNQYATREEPQLVATVGKDFLHVYHFPPETNLIEGVFAIQFPIDQRIKVKLNQEEILYTVAWAFDTYEHKMGRNGYRLVTGGKLGQIYVIDQETGERCNRLRCVGYEVNEIRTNPANSNLIASASADSSIRIHHIRNESCLIVIGGTKCHQMTILTVDWHVEGTYIVTSGYDHQIMKWDLSTPPVKAHLDKACEALKNGEQNQLFQVEAKTDAKQAEYEKEMKDCNDKFRPKIKVSAVSVEKKEKDDVLDVANNLAAYTHPCVYPIYIPSAVVDDIHFNYVDCVRILQGTDVIMSKSCETDRNMCLWLFGPPPGEKNEGKNQPFLATEKCSTLIKKWHAVESDPFFIRFDIDPMRRWLVCGGDEGAIRFFDMHNYDPEPNRTTRVGSASVRQVSFSPCGRFFCAVTDDSLVCRFDRVHKSVNQQDLKKFPNY